MSGDTTTREFFEQKYINDADPWNFASNPYELDRYEAIMNALTHRRYRRAFEPGCSIGLLTSRLARICDELKATDISPTAVTSARERCKSLKNVSFCCETLSCCLPDDRFDLILLSELGYYFDESDLAILAKALIARLSISGVLVAAHWLGRSKDHLISGDRVHEILASGDGLTLEHSERHAEFRLDRWVRR